MNPTPHRHGIELQNTGCGREAMRNLNQYFWQSRNTRAGKAAKLPNLTDLRLMALHIRRSWGMT